MATKEKPNPKKKKAESKVNPVDENVKVRQWRQEQFVRILRKSGLTDDQIDLNIVDSLVSSTASSHDLENLIDQGCDPETAIRIVA